MIIVFQKSARGNAEKCEAYQVPDAATENGSSDHFEKNTSQKYAEEEEPLFIAIQTRFRMVFNAFVVQTLEEQKNERMSLTC